MIFEAVARGAIALSTFPAEGASMRTLLAVFAIGAVLAFSGGCKNHDDDMNHDTHTQKMSSDDVCSHCAGVQHATADGKCPECGAKVNKM
jgi:hypothetical protein